jgi:hypothetical protein
MCVCVCVCIYTHTHTHTHIHMHSIEVLLNFLNINTPAFILLVYYPIECQILPIRSLFDEILPCCV